MSKAEIQFYKGIETGGDFDDNMAEIGATWKDIGEHYEGAMGLATDHWKDVLLTVAGGVLLANMITG